MDKLTGKLFDISIEGKEIDEVIFDDVIITGKIELANKIDKKLVISIISNVPVVQFKEKRVELKPKESRQIEYSILSNLVETHLKGMAVFTAISGSQREELKLPINLTCGK